MITPLMVCGVVIVGTEFGVGYYLKKKIDKYNVKLDNLYKEEERKRNEISDLGKVTQDLRVAKASLMSENVTLKENLEQSKVVSTQSFEEYFSTLEQAYEAKEQEINSRMNQLYDDAMNQYDYLIENLKEDYSNESKELTAELDKIKKTVAAGTEALRRAELDKQALEFYKLKVSEKDLEDVQNLFKLCSTFNNPRALRMIIWSSYFQKETNSLCARIKVEKITGIYKITNTLNGKVYVGQAKEIDTRFKTHIKYGLGIDTPTTNSLYKAMMECGVWNFTFELLEKCNQSELNECERKWIEIYQSDKFGYNGNKGVGK